MPLPGKSRSPVRGNFPQTPGSVLIEWDVSQVVCLRHFYARLHPTNCCSLVRHQAGILERDQKSRQRLPLDLSLIHISHPRRQKFHHLPARTRQAWTWPQFHRLTGRGSNRFGDQIVIGVADDFGGANHFVGSMILPRNKILPLPLSRIKKMNG